MRRKSSVERTLAITVHRIASRADHRSIPPMIELRPRFPSSLGASLIWEQRKRKKKVEMMDERESCVSLRWTREVACRGSRCGQGGKTRFKPRLERVDDLVRVPVPATSSSLSSFDRRQIPVLLIEIYICICLSVDEISIDRKQIDLPDVCFHRWKVVTKIRKLWNMAIISPYFATRNLNKYRKKRWLFWEFETLCLGDI